MPTHARAAAFTYMLECIYLTPARELNWFMLFFFTPCCTALNGTGYANDIKPGLCPKFPKYAHRNPTCVSMYLYNYNIVCLLFTSLP